MNELAFVAIMGVVGSISTGIIAYFAALRKTTADVHIAKVTLESADESDDRKALRDYQNMAIAKREQELTECRQLNSELRSELDNVRFTKDKGIHTLDDAIEVIKIQKEIIQSYTSGGQP